MSNDSLNISINSTIPNALQELETSQKKIDEAVQHFKKYYSHDDMLNQNELQKYIKDAISNVTYHVHAVGLHLTNFLQLQSNEIEKLDLQIEALTDRLKAAKENTGFSGLRTADSLKTFPKTNKMIKLQEHELPENAKPIKGYIRTPINLKALDNVGIDLIGNKDKGMDTSNSTSASIDRNSIRFNTTRPSPFTKPPTLAPPTINLPPSLTPPPPISLSSISSTDTDMLPPPPPLEDIPPPPPPQE
jgi:hypothetical protein